MSTEFTDRGEPDDHRTIEDARSAEEPTSEHLERPDDGLERLDRSAPESTGLREVPLRELHDRHPGEYLEPMSRTTPVERFQDPERTVHQINPMLDSSPAYQVNCADCSRAVERTWRGDREEAAGRSELRGETDGRTQEWAGESFHAMRSADDVRDRVLEGGPGSSAIVHTDFVDHDGNPGGHAYNVVNHEGQVRVVDGQLGEVYDWHEGTGHPAMASVDRVRAVGWDGNGRALW
ncbi:MAG: hypothetical protein IPJ14_16320 [Kineosporiaceae bacterium]|nr:hypothetical protein [Kineosporiaceae bacterium]MBK7624175.1 hypothetical protein [Kineosporiaceae bacterium]MBK8075351.1 hypothetical protein [Kineosporiaceae bacterium]